VLARLLDAREPGSIDAAVDALRAGRAVVVPTDTVYGVAADPSAPGGTERLFVAKRRPHHVQLPVLVEDLAQAGEVVEVPDQAARLMARFWPGALTIVLPRRAAFDADLGGDGASVGVRCPDHPVPRQLCAAVGPLAATSANLHGAATPATAIEVAELLGGAVDLVLDGGPCQGAPSTVVDCSTEPRLLREGRVPWDEVRSELRSPR